jgi:hypothetical protein
MLTLWLGKRLLCQVLRRQPFAILLLAGCHTQPSAVSRSAQLDKIFRCLASIRASSRSRIPISTPQPPIRLLSIDYSRLPFDYRR